jgi:5-methylcytosine-specific restriction endonuclease McrA
VRPTRNDVVWSRGWVVRRAGYQAYMRSPQWSERRRRWVKEWKSYAATHRSGAAPQCRVCGRLWTLKSGDLHHLHYDRLGAELFEDLVPLCRPHHEALHQLYDTSADWRRMGRVQATFGIIGVLQRLHQAATA